jgi:hypothetical protein
MNKNKMSKKHPLQNVSRFLLEFLEDLKSVWGTARPRPSVARGSIVAQPSTLLTYNPDVPNLDL